MFVLSQAFLCYNHYCTAGVVKLADTSDLGSDASRRAGSSPVTRTKIKQSELTLNMVCARFGFYFTIFNETGYKLLGLLTNAIATA